MQCTAHSRRTGLPCKCSAITGRSTCRLHGGKSPTGVAAGRFVHGRYSKVLPTHLRARYETAAADPDLLVLRDEIALTDSRLAELLDRLNDQDNAARWGTVRSAFREYQEALEDVGDDEDAAADALHQLQAAIFAGSDDDRVWDGVREKIEDRRKLVESERERLVKLQQMITAEQVLVLLAQVADTVKRHVSDREALAAISADFARLVVHGSGGDAQPGRAG